MAFEVRCPECNKLYAAEWRMVGKKIRCRQCTNVFVVTAPPGAVPEQVTTLSHGAETDRLQSSDMTGTSKAVVVPPPTATEPYAEAPPTIPSLRPSIPQEFPGSLILEAWLPLGLVLVAAVWTISETFAENETGRAWVALLRLAVVLGIYLLLALPITLWAVKASFAGLRRALPPAPAQRVAVTFALPATLGYVFWLVSGGIGGLATGLIMGLVFMAAVFWLLFRVDPQEAASVYSKAAIAFLVAVAIGAGLLVAMNHWVNEGMVAQRTADSFKESPLGTPLTWYVPPKPPAPKFRPPPDSSSPPAVADPHGGSTVPPASVAQPIEQSQIAQTSTPPATAPSSSINAESGSGTNNAAMPSAQRAAAPQKAVTPLDIARAPQPNPSDDPQLNSRLFDSSPGSSTTRPAGQDGFLEKIRQANFSWVQAVMRPVDEGIYEQIVKPLTPSPYVGLVRLSATGGRMLEPCQLAPSYAGTGTVTLNDHEAESPAFVQHCALSPDGRLVARLLKEDVPRVEIDPVGGTGYSLALLMPTSADFGAPSAGDVLFKPELLGVLPRRQFLVRWAKPGMQVLQVYGLDAKSGRPLLAFSLEQGFSHGAYAVSADGRWFATVVRSAEEPTVKLCSLIDPTYGVSTLTLKDVRDLPLWDCAGIAFSPDGGKVAALLENDGKGSIHCWGTADLKRLARAVCDVPAGDQALGQNRGHGLQWLTNNTWLVHGRTVVNALSGDSLGTWTDQVVTGEQLANAGTLYLSYYGEDGREHIAVVRFDPQALSAQAESRAKAVRAAH